jgi:hypothetical protein
MSEATRQSVRLVAAQAAIQLNRLDEGDRKKLLDGLRHLLPADEFEQCAVLHHAIIAAENAQRIRESAQLCLTDLLTDEQTQPAERVS